MWCTRPTQQCARISCKHDMMQWLPYVLFMLAPPSVVCRLILLMRDLGGSPERGRGMAARLTSFSAQVSPQTDIAVVGMLVAQSFFSFTIEGGRDLCINLLQSWNLRGSRMKNLEFSIFKTALLFLFCYGFQLKVRRVIFLLPCEGYGTVMGSMLQGAFIRLLSLCHHHHSHLCSVRGFTRLSSRWRDWRSRSSA